MLVVSNTCCAAFTGEETQECCCLSLLVTITLMHCYLISARASSHADSQADAQSRVERAESRFFFFF